MWSFCIVAHLKRQFAWSKRTFGPPRGITGVLDHIKKELKEIDDAPTAFERREEWIDVMILAADGFMRDGGTPVELARCWEGKQVTNELRTWPDWRTAEPGKAIEHIREELLCTAPVSPVLANADFPGGYGKGGL